jgi:hypothetical protein
MGANVDCDRSDEALESDLKIGVPDEHPESAPRAAREAPPSINQWFAILKIESK